jgi:hypothetical protein
MKFLISLLFCFKVFGAPIMIKHEKQIERAQVVEELLTTNWNIPENLIEIETTEDCLKEKSSKKLELCIKKNGDLLVVSVNRKFINESLQVFRTP